MLKLSLFLSLGLLGSAPLFSRYLLPSDPFCSLSLKYESDELEKSVYQDYDSDSDVPEELKQDYVDEQTGDAPLKRSVPKPTRLKTILKTRSGPSASYPADDRFCSSLFHKCESQRPQEDFESLSEEVRKLGTLCVLFFPPTFYAFMSGNFSSPLPNPAK